MRRGRCRLIELDGDKSYGNPPVRRYLRRRGITARIDRTLGWLLSYKRLALRYDYTAVTIDALARLAVTLICARRLPTI